MKTITKADDIEFITNQFPEAMLYLIKKGVCGISCGVPVWGTIESVAKEREFSDSEIDKIVSELNNFLLTNSESPEYG